ncbi:Linoleate 13S-lipoxygenase 2-1 chloroplastic [Bienertia sinuspersici]
MFNTSTNIFNKTPSLFPPSKPFVAAGINEPNIVHLYNNNNSPRLGAQNSSIGALFTTRKLYGNGSVTRARQAQRGLKVEAVATTDQEQSVAVKAIVSVKPTVGGLLTNVGITRGLDDITDLLGKSLLLELVSAEAQPNTESQKSTVKGYAHRSTTEDGLVKYEAELVIPPEFGEVGAILVENEHHKEMHLIDIHLNGLPFGSLQFICNSWVQPKFDNPEKRVFFTTKSYLPSQTPSGLKRLREKELEALRGDGTGERKSSERIYDYDTYNDLGDPDNDPELARPVLGDPSSESRSSSVYVPRDEYFSELKQSQFGLKTVYSVLHAVVPSLETVMIDPEQGFPYFTAIDSLFHEGIDCPGLKEHGLQDMLPRLIRTITSLGDNVLRFEPPMIFDRTNMIHSSLLI